MTEPKPLPRGELVRLAVFVALAAGIVAGFMGNIAPYEYMEIGVRNRSHMAAPPIVSIWVVGPVWGAVTGVIVALLWCWAMFRRMTRGRTEHLIAWGTRFGVLAGVLSTILLHLGLGLAAGRANWGLIEALLFGMPVGAFLGAVCGVRCRDIAHPAPPPKPLDAGPDERVC